MPAVSHPHTEGIHEGEHAEVLNQKTVRMPPAQMQHYMSCRLPAVRLDSAQSACDLCLSRPAVTAGPSPLDAADELLPLPRGATDSSAASAAAALASDAWLSAEGSDTSTACAAHASE